MKKNILISVIFIVIITLLITSCKVNQFYTLTITQPENGNIEADPEANSDGEYAEGAVITLTATPDEGYEFLNWENDASGTENPTQILMNYDKEVSAVFGDATPPADVTNLEATAGYKEVVLTWTDPDDSDLDVIQITHDQTGGGAGQTVSVGTETYTWEG